MVVYNTVAFCTIPRNIRRKFRGNFLKQIGYSSIPMNTNEAHMKPSKTMKWRVECSVYVDSRSR